MSTIDGRDYKNRTLIWFLLDSAIKSEEHLRVISLYRDFQTAIDDTATESYRKKIVSSIDAAESTVVYNHKK